MGAVFSDGDKPLAKYCEEINNSLSAVSEGKKAVPLATFTHFTAWQETLGKLSLRFRDSIC